MSSLKDRLAAKKAVEAAKIASLPKYMHYPIGNNNANKNEFNILLPIINEIQKGINPIGSMCIFGSAAIKILYNEKLNTDSDIDTTVLIDDGIDVLDAVVTIISILYANLPKSSNASRTALDNSVIEINIKKDYPETLANVTTILEKFNKIVTNPKIHQYRPNKWITELLNIRPYRILVLAEQVNRTPEIRWLVKLTSSRPISRTVEGYPIYKEYCDINIMGKSSPAAHRPTEYITRFPPIPINIGDKEIFIASKEMILCQQIDLFINIEIHKTAIREFTDVKIEQCRKLWGEFDESVRDRIREIFPPDYIRPFLERIAAPPAAGAGGPPKVAEGGSKRRKRVKSKRNKRRYTKRR